MRAVAGCKHKLMDLGSHQHNGKCLGFLKPFISNNYIYLLENFI